MTKLLFILLTFTCLNLQASTPENYVLQKEQELTKTEKLLESLQKYLKQKKISLSQIRKQIKALYKGEDEDPMNDYSEENYEPFPAQMKLVADPQVGLLSKIMMIRQAQTSIDLMTYIFKRDDVGFAVLKELREAIKRGVSVRILVDSVGTIHFFHGEFKALLTTSRGYQRDNNGNLVYKTDPQTGEYILNDNGQKIPLKADVDIRFFSPLFKASNHLKTFWKHVANIFRKDDDDEKYFRISRRVHDKIMIIDGNYEELTMAITGGRNISKQYYGVPNIMADTYIDMEMIIKNDMSKEYQGPRLGLLTSAHFSKIFYRAGNSVLTASRNALTLGIKDRTYDHHKRQMDKSSEKVFLGVPSINEKYTKLYNESFLSKNFHKGHADFTNELQNFYKPNGNIHHDDDFLKPHDGVNGNSILAHYRKAIWNAQKKIEIVSPYFWLPSNEFSFITSWMNEDLNRTFELITNSVESADNIPAQVLTDLEVAPQFLNNPLWPNSHHQAKVFAFGKLDGTTFGGQEFYGKLHSKFLNIDDEYCFVGSHNFDARSRNHNNEIGFFVSSPSFCKETSKEFAKLKRGSTEWGSPEWLKIRYHKNNRKVTKQQKFIYTIIQKLGLTYLI